MYVARNITGSPVADTGNGIWLSLYQTVSNCFLNEGADGTF